MSWKALHQRMYQTNLGSTKSGKSVFGVLYHHDHSDFEPQDHEDAADLHLANAKQHRTNWLRINKRLTTSPLYNLYGSGVKRAIFPEGQTFAAKAYAKDMAALRGAERDHDHHAQQAALHKESARRMRVSGYSKERPSQPVLPIWDDIKQEVAPKTFLFSSQRKSGQVPGPKDVKPVGHHPSPIAATDPNRLLSEMYSNPTSTVRDVLPYEHQALHSYGKSEDLAKEMIYGNVYGKQRDIMRPLHGWISPSGKFLSMRDDQTHTDAFNRHIKEPNFETAFKKGWITAGASGRPLIEGHHSVLHNRNHPATKKLIQIIKNLDPSLSVFHIYDYAATKPHDVSRDLAEKGIFKKPSVTAMFRSEKMAKEMWGSNNERMDQMEPFHGWIAPDGKFHQMPAEYTHDTEIQDHLGQDVIEAAKESGEIDDTHTASDLARSRGWISIGHAGDPNAVGHAQYIHDPTHPATQTLARMVRDLHPDLKKERFMVGTDTDRVYELPHRSAELGNFRKPSAVQMFRSEDLAQPKQVVSIAVLNTHGQIMMGQRKVEKTWTLPGGHVNEGEDLEAAAHRELKEEAGFDVGVLRFIGSKQIVSEQGVPIEVHCYKTFTDAVDYPEADPDKEVGEWKWVDVNDGLPEEIAHNLHAPKNVTLHLLGLQDWDASVEKFEAVRCLLIDPAQGEDLTKSLKHLLVGGAMLGSTMVPYGHIGTEAPISRQVAPAPREFHPQDRFLDAIAEVESTGGRFTQHKLVTQGIHKGLAAIGKHGLMPLTAKIIAKKASDPKVQALAKLPPQRIATMMDSDPRLAHAVAQEHAEQLHTRFNGNVEKMAYAWFNGANSLGNKSVDKIRNHWYTKKFLNSFKKIQHAQPVDPHDSFFREADHPIHRNVQHVEEIEKAEQMEFPKGGLGTTPEEAEGVLAAKPEPTRTPSQKISGQYFQPSSKPGTYVSWPGEPATTTPLSSLVQGKILNGTVAPADLYRSYKHSPHTPGGLFLKYMIHRHQNHDTYMNPEKAVAADDEFLKFHQEGKSGIKNRHIDAKALHYMVQKNPGLMDKLVNYRDRLHESIKRGIGLNVKDQNGEPHVALTRGLSTPTMDAQHTLSSWSDLQRSGFGLHMHHRWVPLKNIWYTFKMPYKASESKKFGHENEYLVSSDTPLQHRDLPYAQSDEIKEAGIEPRMLRRSGDPLSISPITYDNATQQDVKKAIRSPKFSIQDAQLINEKHGQHLDSRDVDELVDKSQYPEFGSAPVRERQAASGHVLREMLRGNHRAVTAEHIHKILSNPNNTNAAREAMYHPAMDRKGIDIALDRWEKTSENERRYGKHPVMDTLPIAQKNNLTIEDARRVHRGMLSRQDKGVSNLSNNRATWLRYAPVDDEIVGETMGRGNSFEINQLVSYKPKSIKPEHIQKVLDRDKQESPFDSAVNYAIQAPATTPNQLEQVLVNPKFDIHSRRIAMGHKNLAGVRPELLVPHLSDPKLGQETQENLLRHPGLTAEHLKAALGEIGGGNLDWEHKMTLLGLQRKLQDLNTKNLNYNPKVQQLLEDANKAERTDDLLDQVWPARAGKYFEAAQFLSGKPPVSDEEAQEARNLCDDDELGAALHAYGIPDTVDTRNEIEAVLEAMGDTKKIRKAEAEFPHLLAVPGKGEGIVQSVNRGIEAEKITFLEKPGKFSKKAFVVFDPETNEKYVVKPDPGKVSPTQGMSGDFSQPARERAFYELAMALGLEMFMPEVSLAVDGQGNLYTIVKFLKGFKSIDARKKQAPGSDVGILEQYRQRGDLHRLAVLDFVAGSTDRHGNNTFCNDNGDLQILDHGSTLADERFDPFGDKKSFIPYYLRYTGAKRKMSPKEFVRFMPSVALETDHRLKDWIMEIDAQAVQQALRDVPPGIVQAVLKRLSQLQAVIFSQEGKHSASEAVNMAWVGLTV